MNYEVLEHTVNEHGKQLDNHEGRLMKIEGENIALKVDMKNLCDNIKALISVMKWFIGALLVPIIGFLFYGLQHTMFK